MLTLERRVHQVLKESCAEDQPPKIDPNNRAEPSYRVSFLLIGSATASSKSSAWYVANAIDPWQAADALKGQVRTAGATAQTLSSAIATTQSMLPAGLAVIGASYICDQPSLSIANDARLKQLISELKKHIKGPQVIAECSKQEAGAVVRFLACSCDEKRPTNISPLDLKEVDYTGQDHPELVGLACRLSFGVCGTCTEEVVEELGRWSDGVEGGMVMVFPNTDSSTTGKDAAAGTWAPGSLFIKDLYPCPPSSTSDSSTAPSNVLKPDRRARLGLVPVRCFFARAPPAETVEELSKPHASFMRVVGPAGSVSLQLDIDLDVYAVVPSGARVSDGVAALVGQARRLVKQAAMDVAVMGLASMEDPGVKQPRGYAVRCYRPAELAFPVCLPSVMTSEGGRRTALHRALRLPLTVPCFKEECAVDVTGRLEAEGGLPLALLAKGRQLVNPHFSIATGPPSLRTSEKDVALVRGFYEYFHYNQDKCNDDGWGCCYRSIQTVMSWYRLQRMYNKPVPTHWEIQKLLKAQDEAHRALDVGSSTWIGTIEGSYVVEWLVGFPSKILFVQSASDLPNYTRQLMTHFDIEGSPVMMGVGNYAYTLVGVCTDRATGDPWYLMVDPHYTGADNAKTILDKGWVAWKKLEFIEKTAAGKFINLACPQTRTADGTGNAI